MRKIWSTKTIYKVVILNGDLFRSINADAYYSLSEKYFPIEKEGYITAFATLKKAKLFISQWGHTCLDFHILRGKAHRCPIKLFRDYEIVVASASERVTKNELIGCNPGLPISDTVLCKYVILEKHIDFVNPFFLIKKS